MIQSCSECKGKGYRVKSYKICSACHGTGYRSTEDIKDHFRAFQTVQGRGLTLKIP